MVEQQVYTSHDIPPDLKCQALSFLRMEWPEGFVGDNWLRDWITKEADHPLHFVLIEERLLISHLNVIWKYLEHAGETYKTYGLTGVFTYPSFRGQGYGSRLVAAASEYIRKSDADIGMFHCRPKLRSFYSGAGWVPVDAPPTLIGAREDPEQDDGVMMMQFLSEKGKRGQYAFETIPVYFDSDSTW